MGRTYKTAQGRTIDFEQIRLTNELTPAIGNMRVNARGDQLGPGGNVVKSREQMLDEHYKTSVTKRKQVEPDIIPTKGGKASKVDATPRPTRVDDTASAVDEKPLDDDFVDPEEIPPVDSVTGVAKGEKTLKGGLAQAVARSKEYNDSKTKPKRL